MRRMVTVVDGYELAIWRDMRWERNRAGYDGVYLWKKYVKWWGNENMWICGEEEGDIGGSKMEGKQK